MTSKLLSFEDWRKWNLFCDISISLHIISIYAAVLRSRTCLAVAYYRG